MVPILEKVALYFGCAVPSAIFYLITKGQCIKSHNSGPPDWLLNLLGIIEVLTPVAYNGKGDVLDLVYCAVMAIVMTSGMFFYIRDRRQTPEGQPLQPFYDILSRWNQKEETAANYKKNDDINDTNQKSSIDPSFDQIRQDAFKSLLRAIVYGLLYIPVFATMDGFIRACQEPPEIFENRSYLLQLFSASIPVRSTFYYIWVGVTLSLHIALIPLVHVFLHAIQLNVLAWIPNINRKTVIKLYHDLTRFVAQPPLFDKPWMTRSVYDLWSRRWHQVFRPGFHQIAYGPIRRLFGTRHQTLGRLAGTIAVFACSGLMHDYIIIVMLGYSNYKTPGVFGYQTLFFLLQAIATIISVKSPKLPGWLARILTLIWVVYTAPFFVEPYLRVGLHLDAHVPGFPKFMDSRIGGICPYGPRIINN